MAHKSTDTLIPVPGRGGVVHLGRMLVVKKTIQRNQRVVKKLFKKKKANWREMFKGGGSAILN